MPCRHSVTLACLLACVSPFPAMALDNAADGDIVVTGYGLPGTLQQTGGTIVVVDRNGLSRSASGRIEDVLRDAGGMNQFRRSDSRSAHPTSQGASMRGLGGNAASRTLILLDGVPVADPFGGWVSFPAFAQVRTGSIAIARGGGTVRDGAGALTGLITLASRTPADSAPIEASLAYGSRDSIAGSLAIMETLGEGFATLNADYARGDGFIPVVKSQRGPADQAAQYEQYSLQARAVAPLDDDTEIQVSGLFFNDDRNRGLVRTDNHQMGMDASVRVVHQGDWEWEALAYVQTREFSSGFAAADATRTTVTSSLDQFAAPATGKGLKIEVRPPIGERLSLHLGADGRWLSGKSKERYIFVNGSPTRLRQSGGDSDTIGLFAEIGGENADNSLSWSLSGRTDHWRLTGGFLKEQNQAGGNTLTDLLYPRRSGWEPSGRAGIAWRPSAITIRSAVYTGWRLPTLNELYRPFRVGAITTTANPLLNPERLKGVDIGMDYQPSNTLTLGATLFWNRLDHAIANISQSATLRQRQNLDHVTAKGIELNGNLVSGPWTLTGSYSYTRSRVSGGTLAPALTGLRPAQTPRHLGAIGLGWSNPAGVMIAGTVRYIGQQFEDDTNLQPLKDALTLDGVIRLPVAAGLTAELRGENLANARVEAGIAANGIIERATPRTLWVGLRFGR